MSWTSARNFYGLQKPFNFNVAIPFLLSTLILITVLVVCAFLFSKDGLSIGTERFYFLSYITILLLIAMAISRLPAISYIIILWCTLELVVSLSSSSLIPKNTFTSPPDRRFIYHPLLHSVLKPNLHHKIRYDLRNYEESMPWPVNVSEFFGKDFEFHHNSLGLRGADLTVSDRNKELIFFYGGSTTYDYTVTQGATWIERLQTPLKDRFTLVNLGIPGHSTAQHLVQTAFYQNILGKKPVCAVYYGSWNDIGAGHVEDLDPAYANYNSLLLSIRKPQIWLARYSSLLQLADREAKRRFDSMPEPPPFGGIKSIARSDSQLEAHFVEHVGAIAAINNSRGVRSIFMGQILNRDLLESKSHDVNLQFPGLRNKDILRLQERFNFVLKSTAMLSDAQYIDAGVEHFQKNDFTDMGHFSAAGSRKFAALISTEIASRCQ